MKKKDSLFLGIGVIAIVASASIVGYAIMNNNQADDTSSSSNSSQTTAASSASDSSTSSSDTSSSSTNNSSSSYTDGTYSATASYSVDRGGSNSITASVTVKDGKITAVTTKNSYSDHKSGRYVDSFESSVSSDATGESLASYSPSRIGGASLTTRAFSDVLDQIRSDAAA